MIAKSLLPLLTDGPDRPDREGRDRLEILTALLGGPTFDPIFRTEIIRIPRNHPIYRWNCLIDDCERVRKEVATGLCSAHREQLARIQAAGGGMAEFLAEAAPLEPYEWFEDTVCQLCPERPATQARLRLCLRHWRRWWRHSVRHADQADLLSWLEGEESFPGFGQCRVAVCPSLAASAIGLCTGHATHYQQDGRPGGAQAPQDGTREHQPPFTVRHDDEVAFQRWCASAKPVLWSGQIDRKSVV